MSTDQCESLVIVAHGSRRRESNEEVRALARHVSEQAGDRFASVTCGFLELEEPSIPEAIEAAIRSGAGSVAVLPYFLSAGRHVAEDIPAEVEIVRARYPDVKVRVAPYVGAATRMPDLLLAQAGEQE